MFPTVRTRPVRLSNRNCCYSDEQLAAVLEKSDSDLTWSDFAAIFSISSCAGAYDEQLYFVPLAFSHLRTNARDGREYLSGFVEFFSRNTELLQRDRLASAAQEGIADLLRSWTREFDVVHFDAAACAAKGWSVDHSDYVRRTEAVSELLELLLERSVLEAIAENFVQALATSSTPTESAWFLELARAVQDGDIDPLAKVPPKQRRQAASDSAPLRIQELLTEPDLIAAKLKAIQESVIESTLSPTYWFDVRVSLGLAA